MDKKYHVIYVAPSGFKGIVETTKFGVSHMEATSIANESNRRYKPLSYFVEEIVYA